MAGPYPRELNDDDVVRVARNRDDGVAIEQIATDFREHPMTLAKGLRRAGIDEDTEPGTTAGLREARQRIKLLEQEDGLLRRAAAYLSQSNLPAKGFTRS